MTGRKDEREPAVAIQAFLSFLRISQGESTPNTYLRSMMDAYNAGYEEAIRQMETHLNQLLEK